MMSDFLYRNPRLLLLFVAVIVVAGLSSYYVMPRMEDPLLGQRVAVVTTAFPGADTQRVESLVTIPIEQELSDVSEIQEIRSTSRAGLSSLVIELRDEITDVDPVWSRVRSRLADAAEALPEAALTPDFERIELKAFAAIVAVKWMREDPANIVILRRLAAELESSLRDIPGTEKVRRFGDSGEEVVVDVSPQVLSGLGFSVGAIAQQIRESDAHQPAGTLRGEETALIVDVATRRESLDQLGQTRLQYGPFGQTIRLDEIASTRKASVSPPESVALIDGNRAVVVGVLIRSDVRIDHWTDRLQETLRTFGARLPSGAAVDLIFAQSDYVEKRLEHLQWNLLQGMLAVMLVIAILMGWRSTIVVGTALPLSALMVLIGMRLLGIPIHQMSITGLIIALGLLIDNAIVIVDEVRTRLWSGLPSGRAIRDAVAHLGMPLFCSTLTTTLAFAPLALLPGPPGEFVGSIATSVILAINSSFLLAMTVVPALTALLQGPTRVHTFWNYGLHSLRMTRAYRNSLNTMLRKPWLGIGLGILLPAIGFWQAWDLPEQFFPQSDRNQIQIEIELPAASTMAQTQQTAKAIRAALTGRPEIARLHWFLGESAPTFFYNVVPRRRAAPFYGQALVELQPGINPEPVVRQLQRELAERFAESRVLVRQLEQGPPFDAPVEVRLQGPELAVLEELGSELRVLLSETSQVTATRSDLQETLPKLSLSVDEATARRAGLTESEIARQLYAALEGAPAGGLFAGGQELPIRVRVAPREGAARTTAERFDIAQLEELELMTTARRRPPPNAPPALRSAAGGNPAAGSTATVGAPPHRVPLSAVADVNLATEIAAITHRNGKRVNEVQAYLTAGALPAVSLADFQRRLETSNFQLPDGYTLQYGGEVAERDEAVGNLIANAVLLFALMLVTLVASFRSFRIAAIIAGVGGLSMGLGPCALWYFGYPFGFMAIIGTMGLVGVAINDTIVVLAGIRENQLARMGDTSAMSTVVVERTRHIAATTLTTMAGFTPLVVDGGRFWPPLAITILGGVGGATLLALYFVPSVYLLLMGRRLSPQATEPSGRASQ